MAEAHQWPYPNLDHGDRWWGEEKPEALRLPTLFPHKSAVPPGNHDSTPVPQLGADTPIATAFGFLTDRRGSGVDLGVISVDRWTIIEIRECQVYRPACFWRWRRRERPPPLFGSVATVRTRRLFSYSKRVPQPPH